MKTIVTGALQLPEEDLRDLRAFGLEIFLHPDERQPVAHPEQYEAAICNGLFLYNPIERFTKLRAVQLTSAGYDRMPMEYAATHGIRVYNAKGVYSKPMAEFAICGMLQLCKQSRFFAKNQKAHHWEKRKDLLELSEKTVCIVGAGNVGTELAKRLRAFGCYIIGVNRTMWPKSAFDELLPLDALASACAQSDIVILSIALTDETRAIVRSCIPEKMRSGAILVNIARGALVDTGAVIDALQTGHICGAVLDVFEEEPLGQDSPLWDMENVILTPHNSFVGENGHLLFKLIKENLVREYDGAQLV